MVANHDPKCLYIVCSCSSWKTGDHPDRDHGRRDHTAGNLKHWPLLRVKNVSSPYRTLLPPPCPPLAQYQWTSSSLTSHPLSMLLLNPPSPFSTIQSRGTPCLTRTSTTMIFMICHLRVQGRTASRFVAEARKVYSTRVLLLVGLIFSYSLRPVSQVEMQVRKARSTR